MFWVHASRPQGTTRHTHLWKFPPLSIALSLSQASVYRPFFVLWNQEGSMFESGRRKLWHLSPMTGGKGGSPFPLIKVAQDTVASSSGSHIRCFYFFRLNHSVLSFWGGIYKHLLLLLILILTINPVFFTPVSKTSNNVQRLKQQVLWRQSVRCCHSTDLWKMKSLRAGVYNRPHLATRFSVRLHHWKPWRTRSVNGYNMGLWI